MNTNILLAENKNFKFVSVMYQSISNHTPGFNSNHYMYKTFLDAHTYKWLIDVVNTSSYDNAVELEKDVQVKINALTFSATKRK